jgi:hypothetical protein
VVLLSTFKSACRESLQARHSEIQPDWASQLQKSLTSQASAVIPADTYEDSAACVGLFKEQILPFQNSKCGWKATMGEGLLQTYCQGRQLMRLIVTLPEPSNEQWHELRKRVKDISY